MLQYITLNTSWEKLAIDDRVTFHTPDNSFEYFIKKTLQGYYYCYLESGQNKAIFDILGLNAEEFVTSVVNYTSYGNWPEVKTLDDLKKVIKALDDVCIKKWGVLSINTSQFKVGDIVKILPRIGFPSNYYPTYINGMLKYVGRLTTITSVNQHSCKIKLDGSIYFWPFEALQLITSEIDKTVDPHDLKNGDYIKLTCAACKDRPLIYIFREMKNNIIYRHASYSPSDKNIRVDPNTSWFIINTTKIVYATEEEKKLMDEALLEQGYIWNSSTKQLESIGIIDLHKEDITVSSFYDSIKRVDNMFTDILSYRQEESQTETELNLFPKKKHYQLNFNY